MVLIKYIVLLSTLFYNTIYGKSNLPKLITKQELNKIRFISNTGKFTYYQNRSGELMFSTNYSVKVALKGNKNTNYNVYSSYNKKKNIITKNEKFHSIYNIRISKEIYVSDYGINNAKFISKGLSPKLHLNDQWITYYDSYTNKLYVQDIKNSIIKYNIKISNKKNPFFIPDVAMLNENTILFTDLDNEGNSYITSYNLTNKKPSVYYKPKRLSSKIELCKYKNNLFIGVFGLDNIYKGSHIIKEGILNNKKNIIYSSKLNDIGNIICNKNDIIYFIKRTNKDRMQYEVVGLYNNKVNILSDLLYATQIIDMDGKILLPFNGEYYVIEGKSDTSKVDLIKK